VTVRQAGKRLGRNPQYIKGVAEGIGIKLQVASHAIVMTEKDFERLRRRLQTEEAPEPSPAP
jgi:hypothetical protein